MKNILLTVILLFVSIYVSGSGNDSIAKLQQQISHQEYIIGVMQKKNHDFFLLHKKHNIALDSLRVSLLNIQNEMRLLSKKMGKDLQQTQKQVDETTRTFSTSIKSRTIYGTVVLIFLIVLILGLFVMLHKGYTDVGVLKRKADKLNEEILNQLSLDMVEMQKITTSLATLSSAQTSQVNNVTSDHSLVKALADRITFMEMTLYKMDKNVRGYKQLSKSIVQMKDNLKANGYELVDMLGKNYNDGMKVVPNFVEDDTLKEGVQIITGIIKPQINYKGIMIQSAQITVTQNL